MQVAAMNPVAIDKTDVPEKVIAQEIEIGKEQARRDGKPEEMLEKIAQGKLSKFFKESTLLNQDFVKDNKMTVRQYLESVSKDLTVTAFKRYTLNF
jgi:elongation factor Ts